jgi:hypothetical protein
VCVAVVEEFTKGIEIPVQYFPRFLLHFLHLRHCWAPTSCSERTSQVDTTTARIEEGEEQADAPKGEGKPEEGSRSLLLSASSGAIVSAVGQVVSQSVCLGMKSVEERFARSRGETYVIAARVHMELGGHGDSGAKQEDDVEQVDDNGEDWVTRERLVEGDQDEVEQRQHGEGRYEHIVVDERGVACKGHGNDIADERHDDDHEQELRRGRQSVVEAFWTGSEERIAYLDPSQDEVEGAGHHGGGSKWTVVVVMGLTMRCGWTDELALPVCS